MATLTTTLTSAPFKGLEKAISFSDKPSGTDKDVHEDIEAQFLEMDAVQKHDIKEYDEDESDSEGELENVAPHWKDVLSQASRGVTDRTHQEYLNLAKQCATFLVGKGLIADADKFFCTTPPKDADKFICAWIMNAADYILLDGSTRPVHSKPASYAWAQKMRASMTYMFGIVFELGMTAWNATGDGVVMRGNPSISNNVSTYMMSLCRRKVAAGETPQSARAVTWEVLMDLYDYNNNPSHWATDGKDNWGGSLKRKELHLIYCLAFLCLLRSDEVLKLRFENITLGEEKGVSYLSLTLPFRKTHKFGDIKPFVIWELHESEAHICPVRAFAAYIKASKITSGYLFRQTGSGDKLSANDVALTSENFLEMFRNNLVDIGLDPNCYGTHSFRRGGCQYLSSHRRWSL
ncbi:hypothetical protein D9611_011514 [Ephemerocybe angulata]|uniref:DNA breaking-rejoining enzyme n=1 Tax=Ephemerocybe angulata TaxID=980116 RepID=A0A8H5FK73_9AGAR|nr:hypothetical protein D9611_011514 [Tulosesus angulatus]